MSAPPILAITGPGGSGKSTIAALLAKRVERCVNIEVDAVKHMIVNGFIYVDEPRGVPQWELLGTNLGMLAKNFHEAGYAVIINGYLKVVSWHNLEQYVRPTHKVLLLPELETVLARNLSRHKAPSLSTETIREHYAYFSTDDYYRDFVRIDSTGHSVEQTAAKVIEVLGS